MEFICYKKCSTCAKARKLLEEKGAVFTERAIDTDRPTREELRAWQEKSGRPLEKMFNTSGRKYRELGLAARLPGMTGEEMLDLLSSDGMLVKRPVLVTGERVLFGFRKEEWEAVL